MTRLGKRLRDTAAWGIVAVLAWTAAAFGGVGGSTRAWFLFGALACLTLAVWTGTRDDFGRPVRAIAVPIAAIIAWGGFQILPLPSAVVRLVSPRTAALYARTVPDGGGKELPSFLARSAVAGGGRLKDGATVPDGKDDPGGFGVGRTLSISPQDTLEACRSWLAPLLLLLATAVVARVAVLRARLLWGMSFLGAILGASAVAQRLTGKDLFLAGRGVPSGSNPLGPFINPNHFGAYAALTALVAVGLAMAHVAQSGSGTSLRSLRAALVDTSWALPRILALGTMAALALVGLALSRSRGAWLAFGVGSAVLLLARRRAGWLVAGLAFVMVVGVGLGVASRVGLGGGTAMAPFVSHQQDASGAERIDAWAKTVQLFADNPVAGTGLGTFPWAFAAYQRRGEWMVWSQAHNDYLQFLAEAGLVGAIFLIVGLVGFTRRAVLPALVREREPKWSTVGVMAAVTALAVHSIVDFPLQIPALAALASVLVGVVAAAASDRVEDVAS